MAEYTVILRPARGVDSTIALRRLLKYALRACGLTCVGITASDPLGFEAAKGRDVADAGSHARRSGGRRLRVPKTPRRAGASAATCLRLFQRGRYAFTKGAVMTTKPCGSCRCRTTPVGIASYNPRWTRANAVATCSLGHRRMNI
jgi:hypothetical protein